MEYSIVGLVAVVLIFGGSTMTYFIKNMVRLAEIKAQSQTGNANVANAELMQAVSSLRTEFASLRETTTRFDLSFDAAITRLESRLEQVEARQDSTVGSVVTSEVPATSATVQSVGAVGR